MIMVSYVSIIIQPDQEMNMESIEVIQNLSPTLSLWKETSGSFPQVGKIKLASSGRKFDLS